MHQAQVSIEQLETKVREWLTTTKGPVVLSDLSIYLGYKEFEYEPWMVPLINHLRRLWMKVLHRTWQE